MIARPGAGVAAPIRVRVRDESGLDMTRRPSGSPEPFPTAHPMVGSAPQGIHEPPVATDVHRPSRRGCRRRHRRRRSRTGRGDVTRRNPDDDGDAPDLAGPVVARVRDVGTGELTLYVGTDEITYTDRSLARRLVRAAAR